MTDVELNGALQKLLNDLAKGEISAKEQGCLTLEEVIQELRYYQ